jgi:hypothetical protein
MRWDLSPVNGRPAEVPDPQAGTARRNPDGDLRQVPPCVAVPRPVDSVDGDAESRCELPSADLATQPSNLQDRLLRELGGSAPFAPIVWASAEPHPVSVEHIPTVCDPLKVGRSVVRAEAIDVIDFLFCQWWTEKRSAHNLVNIQPNLARTRTIVQAYTDVAMFGTGCQYAARMASPAARRASHATHVRYFVSRMCHNGPPLFGQGKWCRMGMHREDSFPGAGRQAVISGSAVLIVSEGSSTCKKEKEPESAIGGRRLNVGMRGRRCNDARRLVCT